MAMGMATARVRLLCLSTLLMQQAVSGPEGEDEACAEVGMGYWEATLHGGSMPSSIRAMLSPLTTHQTTQLLLHINATTGYLPSHAASFCKAAHIRCGPSNPASAGASPFVYNYRKPAPALEKDKLPDSGPFSYSYRKPAAALEEAKLPGSDPFMYNYRKVPLASHALTSEDTARAGRALMSTTVHEIPGTFFREQQVLVSGAMIHISHATNNRWEKDERAFLPRKLAELFPLSSQGAKQISIMLGVSEEALQVTIDDCSVKNDMSAEVSACLSSVEHISDFVSSVMGSTKPINAYDSVLNASSVKFSGKTFKVESVKALKQDPDEPSVTCHDFGFPFRVFYCHYAKQTMMFYVSLRGEDGTSHERIAVCHYDTSYWDPNHVSFVELHTKPGEAEACHWLGKSWMGQNGWVFSHAI